jgi:hypothetical protein
MLLSDAPIIWCVALCRALAVQAAGTCTIHIDLTTPSTLHPGQYHKKETKQESKQETRDARSGMIDAVQNRIDTCMCRWRTL